MIKLVRNNHISFTKIRYLNKISNVRGFISKSIFLSNLKNEYISSYNLHVMTDNFNLPHIEIQLWLLL